MARRKPAADSIFDLINESGAPETELLDIRNGDAENALLVTMKAGKAFQIPVEKIHS